MQKVQVLRMNNVDELVQDKTPVDIMHIINYLIGVMSERGALIYDDNDEDWFLHHMEYRKDVDEIYFVSDAIPIGGK